MRITLGLAKMIGDDPTNYVGDALEGAIPRLLEAKHRSRHSERAQEKAERRLARIRAELNRRAARWGTDESPVTAH